jgi:hypothetical protein
MRLRFTEEVEEFRSAVKALLDRRCTSADVRLALDTPLGYDPALWRRLAEELGVVGLTVPERHGGGGFSLLEAHAVLEELGRVLAPTPFLGSSILAVQTVLEAGDDSAAERILPSLADGTRIAALAWAESDWDPARCVASATPSTDGLWELSGSKRYVLDGHVADVFLVLARSAGGTAIFEVESAGAGVRVQPLVTMDMTRRQAHVEFDGAVGRLIGREGEGELVLAHVLDIACVALSAEQIGAAEHCLTMTVDYAKERVQFGRPIGSFQALKHRMADLLLLVESARSLSYAAAWIAAHEPARLPALAAAAKSYCSEAFFEVSAETIQLHGGIGFTWEHDAHLYFKRAHGSMHLFGDPAWHRARLATIVGIEPVDSDERAVGTRAAGLGSLAPRRLPQPGSLG